VGQYHCSRLRARQPKSVYISPPPYGAIHNGGVHRGQTKCQPPEIRTEQKCLIIYLVRQNIFTHMRPPRTLGKVYCTTHLNTINTGTYLFICSIKLITLLIAHSNIDDIQTSHACSERKEKHFANDYIEIILLSYESNSDG